MSYSTDGKDFQFIVDDSDAHVVFSANSDYANKVLYNFSASLELTFRVSIFVCVRFRLGLVRFRVGFRFRVILGVRVRVQGCGTGSGS